MAKTSDAKARVYSKYGREIYVVAKSGGLDPTGNLTLRSLIERAKKDQVPTHVIEKAIEKAKVIAQNPNIKILGVATGKESWVNEKAPMGTGEEIMPLGGWDRSWRNNAKKS